MKVLNYNDFVNEAMIDSMSYSQRLFSVIASALYEAEDDIKLHPETYPDAESILNKIKQRALTRYRVMITSESNNVPTEDEFWECFSNLVYRIFDGNGEF